MKHFMLPLCIVFTLFIFTSCNETAKVTGAPKAVKQDISEKIQGAWTLKNMDVGTEANRRTRDDAEFMIFIMKSHYSAIRDLTEGSAQRSFAADAGTYEFDGKEVVVHHMLSAFGVLGSMTFKCSMEGDDILILEPQYDKMEMPGMGSMRPSSSGQMGYGDMAVRYVFERME